MSDLIINVDLENYEKEVTNSVLPVLIDFWAPWCGPCIALAPTLDQVAGKFEGIVKVVKINIDIGFEISKKFGVRGIPALILLDKGEELDRLRVINPPALYSFLNENLQTQIGARDTSASAPEPVEKKQKILAFNSTPKVKEEALARAEIAKNENRLTGFTNRYFETSDRGSPFAWLLKTVDIDKSESLLGIPTKLAALYEGLFFNLMEFKIVDGKMEDSIRVEARPWLHQWLSEIQIGADLDKIPHEFVIFLVGKLLKPNSSFTLDLDASQVNALEHLSSIQETIILGKTPAHKDLVEMKEIVRSITKNRSDGWSHAIANFISKTLLEAPNSIGSAVSDLMLGYRLAIEDAAKTEKELSLLKEVNIDIAKLKSEHPNVDQDAIQKLQSVVHFNNYLAEDAQVHKAKELVQSIFEITRELHSGLTDLTSHTKR